MTNLFQTIVFATRSNDGVVQEHPSLNDALESFMSEDGYRLDFLFPDGRTLYIHRAEYGEDVDSSHINNIVSDLYKIANGKIMIYDPTTKIHQTTDNVVSLFKKTN